MNSLINSKVYLIRVANKAPRLPLASVLPSEQADALARQRLQRCLTSGLPKILRAYGDRELTADVIQALHRWLRAKIQYGPGDHPCAQGYVERLDGWMKYFLSELLAAWLKRWDEYVAPARSIKRTPPDKCLLGNTFLIEILLGSLD